MASYLPTETRTEQTDRQTEMKGSGRRSVMRNAMDECNQSIQCVCKTVTKGRTHKQSLYVSTTTRFGDGDGRTTVGR